MSKEAYESKLQVFESMSAEDIKSPNMPVDVSAQEAENLNHWCQPDKPVLTAAGRIARLDII